MVLPTAHEWQKVMNGEHVAAAPASKPRVAKIEPEKPAWGQGAPAAAKPAWGGAINGSVSAQAAPAPTQPVATTPPAKPAPAWLTS